jgi:hypothetical protein
LPGKIQFSNANLNSKFPSGSHVQEFAVGSVKDCLFGSFRKNLVAIKKRWSACGRQVSLRFALWS